MYLKGWEVVFKVSPHGKLPNPNEDDYYNINPMTYEGVFYQEQPDDDDDDDDDVVRNDDARPLGDDDWIQMTMMHGMMVRPLSMKMTYLC